MAQSSDRPSASVRLALLLFAVALSCAAALALVGVYQLGGVDPKVGQDARNVCAAVEAYHAGLDPYYVKNLKADGWLSFSYPPAFLDALAPVCSSALHIARDRAWLYPLVALVIVGVLLGRRLFAGPLWRRLTAGALVFAGLAGFPWTYQTGNIQWLSGLLLAAFLAALRPYEVAGARRLSLYLAAAILGLYASLKFIEAPALVCLLLLPESAHTRGKLLASAALVFAGVFAVSYFAYGDFFSSFVASLTGQIPDQHSPATEGCNVSLYCFSKPFAALAAGEGTARTVAGLAIYAVLIVLLALPLLTRLGRPWAQSWRDDPRRAAMFVKLALLLVYVIQPRLKQYTFFDPAVILAALTFELPAATVAILGVVDVLAPAAIQLSGFGAGGLLVNWSQAAELLVSYLVIVTAIGESDA